MNARQQERRREAYLAECLFQRLMRQTKVDRKTGCYIWDGATNGGWGGTQYGKLTVRIPRYEGGTGQPTGQSTHKLSYEQFVKKVPQTAPEGKRWEVGHKCHRSLCWFPGHLSAILNTTNVAQRDARKRVSVLVQKAAA